MFTIICAGRRTGKSTAAKAMAHLFGVPCFTPHTLKNTNQLRGLRFVVIDEAARLADDILKDLEDWPVDVYVFGTPRRGSYFNDLCIKYSVRSISSVDRVDDDTLRDMKISLDPECYSSEI